LRHDLLTTFGMALLTGFLAAVPGLGADAGAATTAATTVATATKRAVDYQALPTEEFFKRSEVDQRIGAKAFDLPLLEAAVFHQTNREREKLKLPLFKYGYAMNLMARLHSQEMVERQYFEHDSPVPANRTLADRLKNAGLVNVTAGENLAVLPAKEIGSGHYVTHPGQGNDVWFDEATGKKVEYYTYRGLAQEVVTQWMNSPEHKSNIVEKRFVYMGIGATRGPYEDAKQDSFYFTQNFCATITAASEEKAKGKLGN
jgi:uncharacterized protein YkwD